jgi:hypothetical protein
MGFLDDVKAVPIVKYAAQLGFGVVRKGRFFSLREHDSVIIDPDKNAFWRNSVFQVGRQGGAGGVIDFALEFGGCLNVKDAMKDIAERCGAQKAAHLPAANLVGKQGARLAAADEAKPFELPPRGPNNSAVYRYLVDERGIDGNVVKYFLAEGLLYQDDKQNCVFATERFACVRGTRGGFKRDVAGSDYNECFFVDPSAGEQVKTLVVTESVIDMMSVMTRLICKRGAVELDLRKAINERCFLALCGINKLASLYYCLDKNPSIERVVLAFDNDDAGRAAYESVAAELSLREVRFDKALPPSGKDWNECINHGTCRFKAITKSNSG